MQFQERDFKLLRGLFESRLMTAGHIATLYFGGKKEYTKKRLQKLKAAGFIAERGRRVYEPSVLYLTRKGLLTIKAQGILAEYPALDLPSLDKRARVSDLTIRHELEIMDVKAAFHAALAASDKFSLLEFGTWPLLYQFETPRRGYGADILVKPDGFIRIHEKEDGTKGFSHECFLELDRSSETQDTLINRAISYLEYYRSGGYAVRNGAAPTDFKEFPFRILMVLKSAERRNNTAERLVHNTPAVLSQTWLATLTDVMNDPLGPIWIQPVDYRNATAGTRFHNERPNRGAYRSQPEREAFIESNIKKLRLLES